MNFVLATKTTTLGFYFKRLAAVLFSLVVALQPGCGTSGPLVPASEHRAVLDKVAVVAGTQQPEISFKGFARDKGEGAVSGAGRTLMACVEPLGKGSCSGSICGAAVILWLGVCGVATAVGGVAGAVAAPTGGDVRAAEATLSNALDPKAISESLRDQVASAGHAGGSDLIVAVAPEKAPNTAQTSDYRPLAGLGVKTVLESTLTHVGTRGAGINDPLQIYMQANVRIVQTLDNSELFSKGYEYLGEKLTLSAWSAGQGKRMQQALVKAYEALGTHIYESVFLLYPFPDRGPQGIGLLSAGFGLAPIDPVTRGQLTEDQLIANRLAWTTVNELRPKLQWQAFPRPDDVAASPEEMKRVRDVRYDLVIAREQNLAPAQIVYERQGLTDTQHRIEKPLTRATRYFWTVRARFELDGRQRLTEWGSVHFSARENLTAPSQFSYRFKTPG